MDEAILRILNRLIFIRTAEDRQVEANQLQALIRELEDKKRYNDLWIELAKLFRRMDSTYNSELFAPHFSEELEVTYGVLKEVIEGLYEKNFTRYNFNAMDSDVLGTVYEQYLGSVVTEQDQSTATQGALPFGKSLTVKERRKKRKKQGIYYTPSFVTKYIVQQTVGKYLDEKGYNPSTPPRVLDMACGSGSFLLETFDTIDNFVAKQRGQIHGEETDFSDRARQLEVLQNCIYGVDLDKQAIEVARLNLLLRALHSPEKLPMLDNLYHGDSLRPETWEDAFPKIIEQGGFDIIIGNPPYVRIQTLDKDKIEFFKENFETATGNYDLYILFVEQALKLLNPGGVLGFILPNKFIQADYGIGLRKLLSGNQYIEQIVDFKEFQVFENATTYTCLLFLKKQVNPKFELLFPNTDGDNRTSEIFDVLPSEINSNTLSQKAWILKNPRVNELINKLWTKDVLPLLDLPTKISRGSSSGADKVFIVSKINETLFKTNDGKTVEIEAQVLRTPLSATDFGRYSFHSTTQERIIFPYEISSSGYTLLDENILEKKYPKAYKYLLSQKEVLEKRKGYKTWFSFSAPRSLNLHDRADIVIPLLANKGSYSFLPENKDDYCLMASGGFSISVESDIASSTYILGLLNSNLLFWHLKQISNIFRGGWITCTKQYFGQLPIRQINFENPTEKSAHDEIVKLVEEMLALQKEHQALRPEDDFDTFRSLERKIARVDEEIDQRVYTLYGLTEEEIKIVEGEES